LIKFLEQLIFPICGDEKELVITQSVGDIRENIIFYTARQARRAPLKKNHFLYKTLLWEKVWNIWKL